MEEKKYKKIKKELIIDWIIFVLFFLVFLLLAGEYELAIGMFFIATLMFGSIYLVLIIGNKVNLFVKTKNIVKKVGKYEREIPKEYTVSMASLLLDNVFDEMVDIPAIILSLIGKNILSYNDNNALKVKPIEDFSKLYGHENYVYKCIKENKKIQPDEFRKYVIEDAFKFNYIKKINEPKEPWLKVFLAVVFLPILIMLCAIKIPVESNNIIYIVITTMLSIGAILSPIAIINKYEMDKKNPYKNTKLGNKEVKRLLGLKKYLQEFSLIDNKKINEAILWEDYLAYAYIFGINKKIFEEFKELKQIKNIVN